MILVFSIFPTMRNYENRHWFDVVGPFDFYAYLLQHDSFLPLLLPLAASLPFTMAFSGELSNRFIVYTRIRRSIRSTLVRRFSMNALVTFLVFMVVGVVPQLFVVFGEKRYDTEGYGLTTHEQIETARLASKTFSQLLPYGAWVPVVAYSVYLGLTAALYATITMCSVVVSPNRVLGFSIPWIAYIMASFVMAVLWLEAYSVALAFPFRLQQLPLLNLVFPLIGLLSVSALAVAATISAAPRLHQLQ
ncbi:hypothetical protein [Micropruina sp.]|uniref:hypothetical protein n=1 Tax=Micropruina sp. TaxID=2737536 RepID=UPI0039E30C35